MINQLFESTTIPVLEQVVNFAQTRHSLLAGNLANLDTPGYKVRDLSPQAFESKLKHAIAQSHESATNRSLGDVTKAVNNPIGQISGELETFLYHDESSGNLETQIAAVSKNQLQHNLALSIMTSQFRLLQTAISERV
jgi:flagellar basal-body rod protein FlgB